MRGSGTDHWFLRTLDGSVFGPVRLDELRTWASDGRVAPEHSVSSDQQAWRRASTLPELEMEWTVTFETGVSYGPLNLRALRDHIYDGSVKLDTPLRHRASGQETSVRDKLAEIFGGPSAEKNALQQRVTTLEQRLAATQQQTARAEQERLHERENAARRQDKQKAERLVRDATRAAAVLRDALEKKDADLAAARALGDKAAEQVDALQREITAVTAGARQAADAHEGIERDLRDQNTAARDEAAGLRAELLQLRQDYTAQEADLQLRLTRATTAAEDAGRQLESSRNDCAERDVRLKDANERAADAESRLTTLQAELQSHRDAAGALSSQRDALQARLEQETSALQSRVRLVEEKRDRALSDLQDTEQALRRLQEILDTEQAGARKREKELDGRLAEQVKLHDDEAAAWEEREENLQRKIGQLQRNCEDALADGKDLLKKLEEERKKQRQGFAGVSPLVGLEAQAQAELKRWMKNK